MNKVVAIGSVIVSIILSITCANAGDYPFENIYRYSSHLPYSTEQESLTLKKNSSSRIINLTANWNYVDRQRKTALPYIYSNLDVVQQSKTARHIYEREFFVDKSWRKELVYLYLSETSLRYSIVLN